MTIFRSDDTIVGIIALAAVPWVLWILRRGLRDQRLPIGKSQVSREDRPAAFGIVLAFYGAAAVALAVIGLDLLLGLKVGN